MAKKRNTRTHIEIELEDPFKNGNRGRPPGSGVVQRFLDELFETHPGEWAVFHRTAGSTTHLRRLQKTTHPNLEFTSRKNNDGKTLTVWTRMMPLEDTPEVAGDNEPIVLRKEIDNTIDEAERHANYDKESILESFEAFMRGELR